MRASRRNSPSLRPPGPPTPSRGRQGAGALPPCPWHAHMGGVLVFRARHKAELELLGGGTSTVGPQSVTLGSVSARSPCPRPPRAGAQPRPPPTAPRRTPNADSPTRRALDAAQYPVKRARRTPMCAGHSMRRARPSGSAASGHRNRRHLASRHTPSHRLRLP